MLTIGLEYPNYFIDEDVGAVDICVVLLNCTYHEQVKVLLATEDGRATGKDIIALTRSHISGNVFICSFIDFSSSRLSGVKKDVINRGRGA